MCLLLAVIMKVSSDGLRAGIASALRRTVAAPLLSLQSSSERWRTALAAHDAVLASRDSALLQAMQLPLLQAENERLARLYLLGARLRWGFVPAQALQPASLGDLTTVTLTAGTRAGVKELSPVVAAEGLVGFVETVDEHTSIAKLWTDPDFAVSAMSEDRAAWGIVTPHLGTGADRHMLELRYVGFRHDLKPGTRIVATGFGGVYPELVPIGTVVEQIGTTGDWARTYKVRPAVKPQDVGFVMILQPERSLAGYAGVWETPSGRDSLTRVIAAKGDSIARVRFDQEIRAATDSALMRLRAQGAVMGDSGRTKPPPLASGDSAG